MSREIKSDLIKLQNFIKDYNLCEIAERRNFSKRLNTIHKKLFGILTFFVELQHTTEKKFKVQETCLNFIQECGSDLSTSIFCWIHGAYKPANLILRCSIETFCKGFVGIENPAIMKEKNMYDVINFSKKAKFFSSLAFCRNSFTVITNCYKQLCGIVHSGNLPSKNSINTLKIFPGYHDQKSNDFFKTYLRIIDSFLITIYANYYQFVYKMHYKNRDNFLEVIKKKEKRNIIDFNTN